MMSWDRVQRAPLRKEADRAIMKPAKTNVVDLYTKRKRPPEIIMTITIRDQC